jgi:ribosome recycling factor
MPYTNFDEIKTDLNAKMAKALDALKHDLGGLRTGRANASILESITVTAYGQPSPLLQVASISALDARTLSVSVWDRSIAPAVEKAIRESNLGLNPASDGSLIRIPIPPLTEERRRELGKVAGGYAEDAKQSLLRIRKDAMEGVGALKSSKTIGEDDERRFKDEVQKITDKFVAESASIAKAKQDEILSIG